ncbi:hypothetical protein DFH07DRAFT_958532 [Mycena maculata]|uniref:Uncharacterized protein n=1 Tax=Mycena maculata TaxID=230809 RepID=A0AAD7NF15_9AGAR|nr:hypothetical protein DFH07DRAFT_958532 [Mycena maculata]
MLINGMKNRAMGEHVVHLGCKQSKQSKRSDNSNKENSSQQDTTPPLTDTKPRTPMVDIMAMPTEEAEAGSGKELYNDKLLLSPKRASLKRKRAKSDDETEIGPKESFL